MTDVDEAYERIVEATAKALSVPPVSARKIVNWTQVRNAVIREEYERAIQQGEKADYVYEKLGMKFSVSVSSIRKVIDNVR